MSNSVTRLGSFVEALGILVNVPLSIESELLSAVAGMTESRAEEVLRAAE